MLKLAALLLAVVVICCPSPGDATGTTASLAAKRQLHLQDAAGGSAGPFWHRAADANAVSRRQLLQGGAGGILSNVDICVRVGNRVALRSVSAVVWRLISSTGLGRRSACALTGTGPSVCKGLQRSVDNRACVCKPGYLCDGNTLGGVNPCSPNPCQYGGTCAAGSSGYTCSCAPGVTGTNCDVVINPCGDSPCQNNGICRSDGRRNYTCSCRAGFTGTNCETNIDDCTVNYCQNGGTCVDGIYSSTCSCVPGWAGSYCQINVFNVDECGTNPCQNGGTCTDGLGTFTCACPWGYNVGDICLPQSCWAQIEAGNNFYCAVLRGAGSLSCWGNTGINTPPAGLTGVQMVAADNSTCVVLSPGGTVQCWGDNSKNQLAVPAGLAGVTYIDVSCGGTVCAVYGSGQIKCWGWRSPLGSADVPINLPAAKAVAVAREITCALLVAGTVSCWGGYYIPGSLMPGLTKVTAISAGCDHVCVLKADTTVECWGAYRDTPQSTVPPGLAGAVALSAGPYSTCALTGNGTSIVCWGQVAVPADAIPAGQQAIQLSAGNGSTCLTLSSGAINCFGAASASLPTPPTCSPLGSPN